jgi:type I restriction enzyme M protein
MEANGFNLDLRNPNRTNDLSHRRPEELVGELLRTEEEILALLREIDRELTKG